MLTARTITTAAAAAALRPRPPPSRASSSPTASTYLLLSRAPRRSFQPVRAMATSDAPPKELRLSKSAPVRPRSGEGVESRAADD